MSERFVDSQVAPESPETVDSWVNECEQVVSIARAYDPTPSEGDLADRLERMIAVLRDAKAELDALNHVLGGYHPVHWPFGWEAIEAKWSEKKRKIDE